MQPVQRALLAGLVIGFAAGAVALPSPARADTAWNAGPPFAGPQKTREAISGAACAPITPPVCIVALDEGQSTQFFTFSDKMITPGAVMRLLPESDGWLEFREIDAEGAAYADGYFYLIGSHGLSRKKGEYHLSSFFVFRFPVDKATGKPTFPVSTDKVAPEIARVHLLRDTINSAPGEIGKYAEQPLGEKDGGVNLEGLAVAGKRMYLGFRGPSKDKQAYIMEVNVDGLFTGNALAPVIKTLKLGKDSGIRDLAAVSDGLLVLAGPVQTSGDYAIYHWDLNSDTPKKQQDLTMPNDDAKAETLLVLGQSKTTTTYLSCTTGSPTAARANTASTADGRAPAHAGNRRSPRLSNNSVELLMRPRGN